MARVLFVLLWDPTLAQLGCISIPVLEGRLCKVQKERLTLVVLACALTGLQCERGRGRARDWHLEG